MANLCLTSHMFSYVKWQEAVDACANDNAKVFSIQSEEEDDIFADIV